MQSEFRLNKKKNLILALTIIILLAFCDKVREKIPARIQKDISWRGNVKKVYSEEKPSYPSADEYASNDIETPSRIRKESIEGKWYMCYLSGVNVCAEDGVIVIKQSGREITFSSLLCEDCRDQETGHQRLSWTGTYEKGILKATSLCTHSYTLGDIQYTDNIRYKLYALLLYPTGEFEGHIELTEKVVEEGSIVGVNEYKSFVRITRYFD